MRRAFLEHLPTVFQSTHPIRSATRDARGRENVSDDISIHAPHTECDPDNLLNIPRKHGFQSTHPIRSATCSTAIRHCHSFRFQSTHPIRSATAACLQWLSSLSFQSTHPIRSATGTRGTYIRAFTISIHAPHTECDSRFFDGDYTSFYFNPRTPYGVRPTTFCQSELPVLFQSTHPIRSATALPSYLRYSARFQSTHPIRSATAKITRIDTIKATFRTVLLILLSKKV